MGAAVLATLLSAAALSGPAPVSLTVRYSNAGSDLRAVAHLRCRGHSARADGFLRTVGAARACRAARRMAVFLSTPPSKNRICAMIYGGPEQARITGRIGSRAVDRRFKRTNGCEIADWQRAVPLLPRMRAGREP